MMRKILFVVENLGGGGAERVLPNLLKYVNRSKYEIYVLTLFSNGINRARLPSDIHYVCRSALHFPGMTSVIKFLSAKFLYWYYVKCAFPTVDFDVVIAYMNGLPTKVIWGAIDAKKISWFHGNIRPDEKPNFPKNFITWNSMRRCLDGLDAIVGVSQTVCDSFIKYTGIGNDKVHLIHNTNDIDEINEKSLQGNPYQEQKAAKLNIVSVGHLQRVKGNDLLLQAVTKLKDEGYDFRVTILGEGSEREALEQFIKEHNLQEIVSLPGFINNPYPYVKNADLYVCASRSEGFSTAVSEALILGVPVISTRVSGAEEMLGTANEYGLVCDISADGIYDAMKKMLSSKELRKHYAEQACARRSMFEPSETVGEVERMIEQICQI